MPRLHLVLDTNCFRGLGAEELEALVALGLPIRISEVALGEAWAHSVMMFQRGKKDRRAARGLFFGRVRRVLPCLDESDPIAFVGAAGLALLRADISGTPDPEYADLGARSRRYLRQAARPEFTDEEWMEGGTKDFGPYLDQADAQWRDYNLTEDVIWERRYEDPVLREEHRAAWNALPLAIRYRDMLVHITEALGLSEVERERSDAVVRMLSWRLLNASHEYGRARRNDGADNLLPQHIANGGILITNDGPLLGAVEASGTRQAPWVRHVTEVLEQPLPTCFPWEPEAVEVCRAFRRTSVPEEAIAGARWIEAVGRGAG